MLRRPTAVKEYRARAIQFLTGLRFPATTAQVLAHYTAKNIPMELLEETMALPERTFGSPEEFADVVVAAHLERPPHTWVSREIID